MSVPYHEIRDGNRGGRDLFSWEDVRLVSYKDREMYLGHTSKLGFLDKGGKWRKRDWWASGKLRFLKKTPKRASTCSRNFCRIESLSLLKSDITKS